MLALLPTKYCRRERYRYDEYKAYTGPRPPKQERHDFDTEVIRFGVSDWFSKFFEVISEAWEQEFLRLLNSSC